VEKSGESSGKHLPASSSSSPFASCLNRGQPVVEQSSGVSPEQPELEQSVESSENHLRASSSSASASDLNRAQPVVEQSLGVSPERPQPERSVESSEKHLRASSSSSASASCLSRGQPGVEKAESSSKGDAQESASTRPSTGQTEYASTRPSTGQTEYASTRPSTGQTELSPMLSPAVSSSCQSSRPGSRQEMRALRYDSKMRQEALDIIVREKLLADSGGEMSQKDIDDAVRVQHVARGRCAASAAYQQVTKERGTGNEEDSSENGEDSKQVSQNAEQQNDAEATQKMHDQKTLGKLEDPITDNCLFFKSTRPVHNSLPMLKIKQFRAAIGMPIKVSDRVRIAVENEPGALDVKRRDTRGMFGKVAELEQGWQGKTDEEALADQDAEEDQEMLWAEKDAKDEEDARTVKVWVNLPDERKQPYKEHWVEVTEQTTIDLQHGYIGSQGAVWLSAALQESVDLRELNLRGNYIRDAGIKLVVEAVLKSRLLRYLNLAWNSISDVGVMQICLAMAGSKSLKNLDLSYNRVADLGAEAIALTIDTNPVLKHLDLEGNSMSWHAANWVATACAKSGTNLHLNLNDMYKQKYGCSYEDKVGGFFDSDIPAFLKEAFWPTFRRRWGILADMPLPNSLRHMNGQEDEFGNKVMGARVSTGLSPWQLGGVGDPQNAASDHLPGEIPGRRINTTDKALNLPNVRKEAAQVKKKRGGMQASASSPALPSVGKSASGAKSRTSVRKR